jgi:DNA-binding MarR family transcriptional regulator
MASIEKEMNTSFTHDTHRAMGNIVFTGGWIKAQFESILKPYGLTSPQFNILRILRGSKEWLNMQEIKTRMVEKSPNTTRLCDKLVEKGLVLRERNENDKRQVYLKISVKGLHFIAPIDQANKMDAMKFLNNITPEEANDLTRILDKLRG